MKKNSFLILLYFLFLSFRPIIYIYIHIYNIIEIENIIEIVNYILFCILYCIYNINIYSFLDFFTLLLQSTLFILPIVFLI